MGKRVPRNAGWREQCNDALRFARDIAVVEPRLVSVSPAPVNGGSERERERGGRSRPGPIRLWAAVVCWASLGLAEREKERESGPPVLMGRSRPT